MAEKLFKINEVIEVGYQAPNKQTGQVVIAEIYLPNKEKDSNFPDVTLTEIGTTGTYTGSFTPNAQGTWQLIIHKADGDGQVVKAYSVGAYNVDSVGSAVATADGKVVTVTENVATLDGKVVAVDGKVNTATTKIDTVDSKVVTVDGKVVTVDGKVVAVAGQVTAVDGKVDALDGKVVNVKSVVDGIANAVASLDTPPMAF